MKKKPKNRIGIFGGSFNPPTKSHLKVAELVLKNKLVDHIWFLPVYKHSFGKMVATPMDRLEMIYRTIKHKKNMEVCQYEIISESDGKLYNTMNHLIDTNPNTEFKVIIGMDAAIDIQDDKWFKWEELTKLVPFIVVEREGYDSLRCNEDYYYWFEGRPHAVLENKNNIDSSTEARLSIANRDKEGMEKILHKDVIEYINQNHLYTVNT